MTESESRTDTARPRDTLTALAFAAAVTFAFGLLYWRWYIDDTFIYLQFARNLATGNGFSFNPGEVVYSVTGPLWGLLIAALARFGDLDYLLAAKVLGISTGIAATVVYFHLAAQAVATRWLVWTAAALFALDGWWARTPFSGMEGAGVVLAILLALLLRGRERDRGYSGFAWSPVVLALGAMLRPEVHLLFVLSLLARYLDERSVRKLLIEALTYLGVSLPWLAYAWTQFGTVVPTTFAAKRDQISFLAAALGSTSRLAQIVGVSQGLALVVMLVASPLLRRDIRERGMWLPFAWMVALPAFYVVRGVGSLLTSRYLIMVTPLVLLFAVRGIELLASRLAIRTRDVALKATVGLLLAQALWFQFVMVLPSSRLSIRDFDTSWKYTALWVKANTPKDARIATSVLGVLGYYSDRYIVDTSGLVRPEALEYPPGDNGVRWSYLYAQRVDYFYAGADMPTATSRMLMVLERPQLSGSGLSNPKPTSTRIYRVLPPP